jgi:hypothetical protein
LPAPPDVSCLFEDVLFFSYFPLSNFPHARLSFISPVSAMTMSVKYVVPSMLMAMLFFGCERQAPADPCCSVSEAPASANLDDEQGLLQVQGSTGARFYVFSEEGEQVGVQLLNQTIVLNEGKYQVKVNNSVYPVELRAGTRITCSTGTLIVMGNSPDNYYVMDMNNQQLGAELLGKQMSFFPGAFKVRLNNTEDTVAVEARQITEVRSGTLVVHGSTPEYYYVLDSASRQLNYNVLEKPLAFLPGTYPVKINNSTLSAQIEANRMTELATGCLVVKGLTDEYYYVSDTSGHALNYQVLNKVLAFFPGKVHVSVNNTITVANVEAGDTTEFTTGSLMLTGTGTEYYYVLDGGGKQLNYNSLNKSLSFFPSQYIVRLGQSTRKATVVAGQLTSMDAFN